MKRFGGTAGIGLKCRHHSGGWPQVDHSMWQVASMSWRRFGPDAQGWWQCSGIRVGGWQQILTCLDVMMFLCFSSFNVVGAGMLLHMDTGNNKHFTSFKQIINVRQ